MEDSGIFAIIPPYGFHIMNGVSSFRKIFQSPWRAFSGMGFFMKSDFALKFVFGNNGFPWRRNSGGMVLGYPAMNKTDSIQLTSEQSFRVNPNSGKLLSMIWRSLSNSDEEIFVEFIGGDFLPFVENLGGVLFQCSRDVENRHRGWDWYEVDFPGEENPEASAAAASDCPEKVFPHCSSVQNPPRRVHNTRVDNVVRSEAVPSHHGPIRAAGYVPSDSQARTKPRRKTKNLAFLRDSVVHFSDRRPGLDPSAVIRNINLNSPELHQINQDKRRRRFHLRRVRYPFVVMAAAADSELNSGFFSANDGGLDVGFIQRGEYEQRLGR
nr:hypothetical protein CR513_20005 [Ipomoea trifida]